MKRLIVILFLFITILVNAAERYFVPGGVDNNWGTVGNWSLTSGGAGGQAVPLATDNVHFDANSPACTVNTSSRVALTLDFTGYTNTITMTAALSVTVSGNVTLAIGMTITGTGTLVVNAAATMTSNGKTWPTALSLTAAVTYTLADSWTVTGTFSQSGGTKVVNGNTMNIGGAFTMTSTMSGTTLMNFNGTGTWSGAGTVQNNLTINTAGTTTISGGVVYNTGTFTRTAGTVVTTGSTVTVSTSTTFNTAGMSFADITISGSATLTLNSLLTLTGTLTVNSGLALTFAGAFGFSVATLTYSNLSGQTQTFVNGVTYTITTAFNAFKSNTTTILAFTSDHASIRANIALSPGATCNVLANFTRINATGRTIWSFNGIITDCLNVNSFTDLKTVGSSI